MSLITNRSTRSISALAPSKMPEMKCHREVKGREALYTKLEIRLAQEVQWIPSKRRFMSLGNVSTVFIILHLFLSSCRLCLPHLCFLSQLLKLCLIELFQGEVTFMERDHAIRGILNLSKMFKMFPETYAMAVNFMDRFLSLLKVC